MLAFWVKQVNKLIYHNSLAPGASVSPDVQLGHNSLGIVDQPQRRDRARVKKSHNVTLAAGRIERPREGAGSAADAGQTNGRVEPHELAAHEIPPCPGKIVLEDHVTIGANSVVIGSRAHLRIGRGARVGAGTVVTHDVPAGATVVGAPVRVLTDGEDAGDPTREPSES